MTTTESTMMTTYKELADDMTDLTGRRRQVAKEAVRRVASGEPLHAHRDKISRFAAELMDEWGYDDDLRQRELGHYLMEALVEATFPSPSLETIHVQADYSDDVFAEEEVAGHYVWLDTRISVDPPLASLAVARPVAYYDGETVHLGWMGEEDELQHTHWTHQDLTIEEARAAIEDAGEQRSACWGRLLDQIEVGLA